MKKKVTEFLKSLYYPIYNRLSSEPFKFGIELEFPLVSIHDTPADLVQAKKILTLLSLENNWKPALKDIHGNFIKAINDDGTIISYEACYCIIEFSLPPQSNLVTMEEKIKKLYYIVQNFLKKIELKLIPCGLNPFSWAKNIPPLDTPYIQMIYGLSNTFTPNHSPKINYFHFLTCASQLHLDVQSNNVASYLNLYNSISWAKALLFANSLDLHENSSGCLCMRDVYYRDNTMGYNPLNVGTDSKWFTSTEDFLETQLNKSIFHVIRDNKYVFFKPLPLIDFFQEKYINGIVAFGSGVEFFSFTPEPTDIRFFRSYNHSALTSKGTIEIRSECQQPFPDVMCSAAFHIGLFYNMKKALNHVEHYKNHLLDFSNLRYVTIQIGYAIQDKLLFNIHDFIYQLLNISKEGLSLRGANEEAYLDSLYNRLENQTNPAIDLKNALKQGRSIYDYFKEKSEEPLGIQKDYATNYHWN